MAALMAQRGSKAGVSFGVRALLALLLALVTLSLGTAAAANAYEAATAHCCLSSGEAGNDGAPDDDRAVPHQHCHCHAPALDPARGRTSEPVAFAAERLPVPGRTVAIAARDVDPALRPPKA